MFNNINDNNEFLYNSQFDKQSNIVNIAALRANVNKTIKTAYSNPYVDKTEISANAMEMFQRDCDINKFTKIAMEQLHKLAGCEAHSTVILSQVDETTFRKLGINITYEPKYQNKKLFHG